MNDAEMTQFSPEPRKVVTDPNPYARPDRLVVGDIWEFETEVKVKGKRKPQAVTLQWEVKGYHPGECAWQLQSLDGQHCVYLWEHAPQYEEMAYVGTEGKVGVAPEQEAIAKLQALTGSDSELAHQEAGEILCEFIRAIGHAEVAAAFEAAKDRVGFWYVLVSPIDCPDP